MRRLPVFATAIVLLAVAIMIALGFWQLRRLHWKESLLSQYAAAQSDSRVVTLTTVPVDGTYAYRHVAVTCDRVTGWQQLSGRSADGRSGWAQVARCQTGASGSVDVVAGWSPGPQPVSWQGGAVTGVLVPGSATKVHIVADPPVAGFVANARPDPADVPNNHLAYAVQWFLFAATALIVYAIALRKRLAAAPQHG